MKELHLEGLEGTNPLAFFAALGVQVAFEGEATVPNLWWSEGVLPHAIVDGEFSTDQIASRVAAVATDWVDAPALGSRFRIDDVKLSAQETRSYVATALGEAVSDSLAGSLVSEGSVDNNGKSKPTDFHFTAGNQKFLGLAQTILEGVRRQDIVPALEGDWPYDSKLPSMGWDVVDDRAYALRATNPATNKKLTNPGAEALAILGLVRFPTFGSAGRTLTPGCSGRWKRGAFVWPIWRLPASAHSVRSLIAQVPIRMENDSARLNWLRSWSVTTILRSRISRSDQGGYGSFSPSEVIWTR